PVVKGITFHFVCVRAAIARELWTREFYVGVSVLDSLLFGALKANSSTPVLDLFQTLIAAEIHSPGFVVYPIHSLGLLGAGVLPLLSPPGKASDANLLVEAYGLVLSPQTNSLKDTAKVLKRAA